MTDRKTIIEVVDKNSQLNTDDQIVIAKDYQVQYVFLLTDEVDDFIDTREVVVESGARLDIYYCYFGKNNVNVKRNFTIQTRAEVNHHLIFFGNDQQDYNIVENYKFVEAGAKGRFKINGIVAKQARSTGSSLINIFKDAQHTDSHLEMNSFIMDNGHSNMVPALEIKANDVKASHSATTTQLDKDQLFYLQSRGVSQSEAKVLFIEGLFTDFVKDIDDVNVRDKIMQISNQRM